MKKNFYLLLLSFFLLLMGSFSFAQTPYFKEKLKTLLNEQNFIDVEVGQIEGIFPFWMQSENVILHLEESSISIGTLSFSFSPLNLLRKHLTIPYLEARDVIISTSKSGTSSWPHFPYSLELYSFKIEQLKYNELSLIALNGSFESAPSGGNFFLTIDIAEKQHDLSLHLHIDGDATTQNLAMIGHLEKAEQELWIGGNYSLLEKEWKGEIHGQGSFHEPKKQWQISTPCTIDSLYHLHAAPLLLTIEALLFEGNVELSLLTGDFKYNSTVAESPLLASGTLCYNVDEALAQIDLQLSYLDNFLKSNCAYHLKTNECIGNLTFKSPHIETSAPLLQTLFNIEESLHGGIDATFSFTEQEMSAVATLSHFNWGDLYIKEGSFDSKGERTKPLAFTLDIADFHVLRPTFEVFPVLHLKAEGSATKDLFKMTGKIGGLGKETFTLTCKIPTLFSLKPLTYQIDPLTPFSIRCEGEGSIDPLLSFLENASLIAQGELSTNLEISGLWGASEITGYLAFNHGHIQDLTTGALFQDLSITLKGDKEKILIQSFTARDAHQGRIRGSGEIVWDHDFPFHIDLEAERFLLFALDPFSAHTDAHITLSGTLQNILIAGDATLLRGLITIPNKLPIKIPTLEVTYCNPLPSIPLQEKKGSAFPVKITWDVAIHIPKNLEIEGRGFYSDWKGALKIQGSGSERIFKGELTLVEGRFEFARHKFHLDKGMIVIHGRDPKECTLDVEASVELGGCITFMNVRGALDKTKMTFTSTPPMSTEQIFSRLLFDSDLNELTPFQACRLAKFLVTLSGNYSGPSTFDTIKESIGIDVLDITRANIDEMDFTFQVGKYISQGTYVGINKSISGDFDSVEIQTRIYQDFFLQGNYGGSLNGLTPSAGKIILKWYKSY